VVAADEAIGVGIDAGGGADGAALDDDRDATGEARRVVAKRHRLADEGGVDFEDDALETDGAVLLHFALLLEEKERREVLRRERDVVGRTGPLLPGRGVLQSPVRRVEVLVLDPRPEPVIDRVERPRVGLEQRGQELEADRPEPALKLSLGVSCRLHRKRAVRHKPFASPIPSIHSVAGRST